MVHAGGIGRGQGIGQGLPARQPVSSERLKGSERIRRWNCTGVPLNNVTDGIEHAFAPGAHAALDQRAPLLTGEWLFASGARLSNVAPLSSDNALTGALAH